jgi:hypothetical protein
MIEVIHNFDAARFMWLWAKYVGGFNERHHCTNAIRGHYSKKFSKNNPAFLGDVVFDEWPTSSYDAIYICGVAKEGYARKKNYPHNVHAAIVPDAGFRDEWSFEGWRMAVRNGRLLPIPASAKDLPEPYRTLPDAYTSCRIFRWAACRYWHPIDGL